MEVWITLKENNDCEVSNYGNFKNNGRISESGIVNDYIKANYKTESGRKSEGIHRLVYRYFKGEIPNGMVINHLDGNKRNNHIDNLELTTQSENIKHAYKNNLFTNRSYGKK